MSVYFFSQDTDFPVIVNSQEYHEVKNVTNK